MIKLSRPITIGNLTIRNRAFLAPMSGVSDLPFRELAWQGGAGLVFSEMIASAELCKGRSKSQTRLSHHTIDIHAVQLSGRDPFWIKEAAKIVEAEGAKIIDINMGCPAKKVTGSSCGAALLRDEKLALEIIKAAVEAVSIPVTLKMRLGWDRGTINAHKIAKEAEALGVQMVTIHGRTRADFYNGQADWSLIQSVREVIKIPLVVNGDIKNQNTAMKALTLSGADAIMIGRASYGQPWIVGEIAGVYKERNILHYVLNHYNKILEHYGEEMGIRCARKHLGWYIEKHSKKIIEKAYYQALMKETKPAYVRDKLKFFLG